MIKQYAIIALSCLLSSTITAITLAILGNIYFVQPLKKHAVEVGVAEWAVTDFATGATEFRWYELVQEMYGDDCTLDMVEKPLK